MWWWRSFKFIKCGGGVRLKFIKCGGGVGLKFIKCVGGVGFRRHSEVGSVASPKGSALVKLIVASEVRE